MTRVNLPDCSEINDYDLIVVGAGIAGATVAYIAAKEYKMRVLVLEKADTPGGLLADNELADGSVSTRAGAHFVHTDDFQVLEFLKSLGRWIKYQCAFSVDIGGKTVNLPIDDIGLDTLFGEKTGMKIKEHIANSFQSPFVSYSNLVKNVNPYVRKAAESIKDNIITPLRTGFFQDSIKKDRFEDSFWLCNGLNQGFYGENGQIFPRGGYSALIKKLLDVTGIEICYGVNAAECLSPDLLHGIMRFDGVPVEIPIMYTGPLDELFGYEYGELSHIFLKKAEDAPVPECQNNADILISNCYLYTTSDKARKMALTDTEDFFEDELLKECKTKHSVDVAIAKENRWEAFRICDSKDEGAFPFIPSYKTSYPPYKQYASIAEGIKNLYYCGHLPEYRSMSISDTIRSAMEAFSKIDFPHPISLIPNNVTYRRPMEELLTPANGFEKNKDYPSELILGDLSRPVPEITVIIPTYKRADNLKITLKSVLSQTVSPDRYEILIVDNDPEKENETEQYLREAGIDNLFYYRNTKNLGAYGNMNRCIELARTKWLSMVHDDDIVFSNAVQWALTSIKYLKDPKLGMVLPRQIIAGTDEELARRAGESGSFPKKIPIPPLPKNTLRWKVYNRLLAKNTRRYWRVSKVDCYFVPFLYPAPSYGSLINRDAVIDIGGYGEGYSNDDGLCSIRMSEKYHVYLCGEAWGVYSFATADVNNPRAALQFVDCVEQYRRYMQSKNLLCHMAGKFYCQPSYIYSVEDDFGALRFKKGYCVNRSNYRYYNQYSASRNQIRASRFIRKAWNFKILLKAAMFGKRITRKQIVESAGEHV